MAENDLELYTMPGCPYCHKVLRYMEGRGIRIPLHDVTASPEDDAYLRERGGKFQVPCLFIDGAPLYESDDIISYLERCFS